VGHRGYRTAALQKALNTKADADLNGDGEFGMKTQAAVKAFQKSAGLPVTGKGDAVTLAALGLAPVVEKPPEPEQPAQPGSVRVTGGEVNIRTGPGTNYDVVKAVKKGSLLASVAVDGWRPVFLDGDVCWISAECSEEINS
jgi:peptidoglycan hydrolase-like protein with peptidoglycan-binding domain